MVDILQTAVSGLRASQRNLATVSHNIANVNTEGFSRQRVELGTRLAEPSGGGFIGSGVSTLTTQRLYSEFVNTEVRLNQTAFGQLEVFHELSSQIDNRLADPQTGLSPAIREFFDAIHALADDPSSIPVRQVALSQAAVLADRFHSLDQHFDALRGRLNGEIDAVVEEIGAMAQSIADLNEEVRVAGAIGGGQPPNDLLDQRDQLINRLSERVSVSVLPQEDGSVNVFVGSGQSLVAGTTVATLETQGGEYDPSRREVLADSLTITSSLVGGKIGGLLDFRDQVLEPARNTLGRVALGMAADFNAQHVLGLDLDGNLGGAFFTVPSLETLPSRDNAGGATVSVSLVDSDALTTSDYGLRFDGGTSYTLTRQSDGQAFAVDTSVPASLEHDGFTLTIGAGAAVGDRFLIRPTAKGAAEIGRALGDVRRIAAAGAVRAGEAIDARGLPTNTGSGAISQPVVGDATNLKLGAPPVSGSLTLSFDAAANQFNLVSDPAAEGPLAYDPATDSAGKSFTLPSYGNMRFSLSGVPADGDSFVIADNDNGVADNRNALLLARLQTNNTLAGGTASYQAAYGQMTSQIGTQTHQAEINRAAQQGMLDQSRQARASISGVNLDEEAANLVRFEQAYQASARVVAVADTVFQTLLNAIGR